MLKQNSFILTIIIVVQAAHLHAIELENWQSCCGAVCLKVVGGLLGDHIELAEVRSMLNPNSRGETSLAEIAATAKEMGYHAYGLTINSQKLEECTSPLVAHEPPKHFVVLVGLGQGQGVLMIDPPRKNRVLKEEDLKERKSWNVVAVSTVPLSVEKMRFRKSPQKVQRIDDLPNRISGLEFDSRVWFFGKMRPKEQRVHSFRFENCRSDPVFITEAKASCPCIEVLGYTKESILPGSIGLIKVRCDSTGMMGYLNKRVLCRIRAADKTNNEDIFLLVSGEVTRDGDLLVQPSSVEMYNVAQGDTVKKRVSLRRLGFGRLFLRDITCDSPNVSVKVIDGDNSDDYRAEVELTYHANDKIGPFHHKLMIETKHEEFATKTLNIEGSIVSPIKSEPESLFLGLLQKDEPFKRSITLKSLLNKPFHVESIESSLRTIKAVAKPVSENKTAWRVLVNNDGGVRPGIMKGELTLTVNGIGMHRILKIPFTGLIGD